MTIPIMSRVWYNNCEIIFEQLIASGFWAWVWYEDINMKDDSGVYDIIRVSGDDYGWVLK